MYLIDALDDFDKDKKNGNYNVFVNAYPLAQSKTELVDKQRPELEYVFSTVLGDIYELSKQLDYKFNHDLTDNILMRGLNVETKRVFGEKDCCKKTAKA